MNTTPNIYRTDAPAGTYLPPAGSGLRFLVFTNMGTQSPHDATTTDPAPATAAALRRLTGPELDACVLHLADGWPQATVAAWMGVSRRGLQLLLASAAAKVPALRSLWARAADAPPQRRHRRPRVLHLSQLGSAEHGPFDADDL